MSGYGLQNQLKGRRGVTLPAPASTEVVANRSGDPPLTSLPSPEGAKAQIETARRKFDTFCEVLRSGAGVPDGMGGTNAAPIVAGRYPCFLTSIQVRAEEVVAGNGGVMSITSWLLYVPLGADIRTEDRIAVPGWMNEWEAAATLDTDAFAIPTTAGGGQSLYYRVAQSGVSGAAEPAWPGQIGAQVTDGTIIWRCEGGVRLLEVLGTDLNTSSAGELEVRCKSLDL